MSLGLIAILTFNISAEFSDSISIGAVMLDISFTSIRYFIFKAERESPNKQYNTNVAIYCILIITQVTLFGPKLYSILKKSKTVKAAVSQMSMYTYFSSQSKSSSTNIAFGNDMNSNILRQSSKKVRFLFDFPSSFYFIK